MSNPDVYLLDPDRAARFLDAVRSVNDLDTSASPVIVQSLALDTLHDVAMAMVEHGGERRLAAHAWADDIIDGRESFKKGYGFMAHDPEGFVRFAYCDQNRTPAAVLRLLQEAQRLAPDISGVDAHRTLLDFATAAITDAYPQSEPYLQEEMFYKILRTLVEIARYVRFRSLSLDRLDTILPAIPQSGDNLLDVIALRHCYRIVNASLVGSNRVDAESLWHIALLAAEELIKDRMRSGTFDSDDMHRWVHDISDGSISSKIVSTAGGSIPRPHVSESSDDDIPHPAGVNLMSASRMAAEIRKDLSHYPDGPTDKIALSLASQSLMLHLHVATQIGILSLTDARKYLAQRVHVLSHHNPSCH